MKIYTVEQREIKFKVYHENKFVGFERLTETDDDIFWEWTCIEVYSKGKWEWFTGTFPGGQKYVRVQFSGVVDNNGREIYEGDIMRDDKYGSTEISKVVFLDGCFACDYGKLGQYPISRRLGYDATVIGNVIENPELLTNPKSK